MRVLIWWLFSIPITGRRSHYAQSGGHYLAPCSLANKTTRRLIVDFALNIAVQFCFLCNALISSAVLTFDLFTSSGGSIISLRQLISMDYSPDCSLLTEVLYESCGDADELTQTIRG